MPRFIVYATARLKYEAVIEADSLEEAEDMAYDEPYKLDFKEVDADDVSMDIIGVEEE